MDWLWKVRAKLLVCFFMVITLPILAAENIVEKVEREELKQVSLRKLNEVSGGVKSARKTEPVLDISTKALESILEKNNMQSKVDVEGLSFERLNKRIFSVDRWKPWGIPSRIKCTEFDKRSIHFCLEPRFFEPSARVFFDTGTDDPYEIDVFNNGSLNVNIDLVALYLPWRIGKSESYDSWSLGPMVGMGISSPPQDSANGESEAPTAPVVMFSYGMLLEYKIGQGSSVGFEIGRATGYSSDESLGDNRDSAMYVGVRFDIKRPD